MMKSTATEGLSLACPPSRPKNNMVSESLHLQQQEHRLDTTLKKIKSLWFGVILPLAPFVDLGSKGLND
jgi:hypothetical protein